MPRTASNLAASVAPDEIDQFSRLSADWWNPEGAFKPLHRLNPVRLAYIRDAVLSHFSLKAPGPKSFKGLKVLDVGCGGGLLAEPLARLGGEVTAIDMADEGLKVARKHSAAMGLKIRYLLSSVEDLARKPQRFDVITALEVVEHVADVDSFLRSLSVLLKPNGILIISTLSRTPKSFLLGIIAAEYILRWVPAGTHQWKKFIRPSELQRRLDEHGMTMHDLTGLAFNPARNEFELRTGDLDVNYLCAAHKV
jgi:2-polyprenyl-6-hydroxyphenyl methylase/3-demethylubiquinone-9 3-methyltransferase